STVMRSALSLHDALPISFRYEEEIHFTEGLAPVRHEGKYGFMRVDGSWAVKPVFDYAGYFTNALALVQQDDKYGFVDHTGTAVIQLEYDDGYDLDEETATVKKSTYWGCIDK